MSFTTKAVSEIPRQARGQKPRLGLHADDASPLLAILRPGFRQAAVRNVVRFDAECVLPGRRRRSALPSAAMNCRDLDNAIARRDVEFIPRKGFMEVRERGGPGSVLRDARNRRGRPKRSSCRADPLLRARCSFYY